MPTKKPAKKTKATQVSKTKTNPWKVGGIVFASIVVILVASVLIITKVWKVTPFEGARMSTYLKNKYGQDFIVSNVRLEGAAVGVAGEIEADAYPKNDPTLKFMIGKDEDDWATDNYIHDTFLEKLWSKQESSRVDAFLKNNIKNVDGYILTIRPSRSTLGAVKGHTPSFSEARQKYPDGFSYTLSVSSTANNLTKEPSEAELDTAFRIVNFVKEAKGISLQVYYIYKDAAFNKVDQAGQDEYQYQISVGKDDIQDINTPNDLAQHFKLINN